MKSHRDFENKKRAKLHLKFKWSNASLQQEGNIICAVGEPGMDSCGGDSGGPMMILRVEGAALRWYAIGVLNYGSAECGIGLNAVHLRVFSYMDWILEHIQP